MGSGADCLVVFFVSDSACACLEMREKCENSPVCVRVYWAVPLQHGDPGGDLSLYQAQASHQHFRALPEPPTDCQQQQPLPPVGTEHHLLDPPPPPPDATVSEMCPAAAPQMGDAIEHSHQELELKKNLEVDDLA